MNGNELYRSISLHHIITRTSSFYVNKFKKKCYQKRIHAYDKTLYIFNEDNLRNIINISLCYASATQVLRWRRLGTTTATDANITDTCRFELKLVETRQVVGSCASSVMTKYL